MTSAFGVDHGDEISKAGNPMLGKIGHFTQTAGKTGGKHKMGTPTKLGAEAASARRATAATQRARFGGGGAAASGGAAKFGGGMRANLKPMARQAAGGARARVGGMSDRAKVGGVAAGAAGLGATGGTAYSQKKPFGKSREVATTAAGVAIGGGAAMAYNKKKRGSVWRGAMNGPKPGFKPEVKKSAFDVEHEVGKALASPMPKMARLTKPKTAGVAKPAGAAPANPMLRQVNRLSQGTMKVGGQPGAALGQRKAQMGAQVRANASRRGVR